MKDEKISLGSYQELADHYDKDVDEKPFNAYYERPALTSMIPDVKDKKVLDAGCAAGYYTEWLIKNGADVTAVDFSPNMIQKTKKRVENKANIILADLNEPLDFLQNGSIDIVVSSLTLHYLKDWGRVMKEFNRILKEKGHLVFSTHHPFMDYSYFECENYFETKLITDTWETPEKDVDVDFYRRPLKEITRPVSENGFVIETIDEPMPTEKFKEENPESYERLTKEPQFLFIRAKKI